MHFLLVVLALSQTPEPQRGAKQQQDTAKPQLRGSDALPVAVKLLNTGKTDAEAQQEDRRATETTEINKEQLTANKILTVLAVLSALLAWWTLVQTRKINRQQLRAYIGVEPKGVTGGWDHDSKNAPIGFQIFLKNHGSTPASDVTFTMSKKVLPLRLPNDFVFVDQRDPDTPPRFALFPGAILDGGSNTDANPLSEGDWDAFRTGKDTAGREVRLYCYGTVRYTDAFGGKHWTNFNHRYDFSIITRPGEGERQVIAARPAIHNDIGSYGK